MDARFLTILLLLPMTAHAAYADDVTTADPDLNTPLVSLGRLGTDLSILRQQDLHAIDLDQDGTLSPGDLILAGGEVGSRLGAGTTGAVATPIDRLVLLDADADGRHDDPESLYWSDGDGTTASAIRLRGYGGPGLVNPSDSDYDRSVAQYGGPLYISFQDDDADGRPDSTEPAFLSMGQPANQVSAGQIRLTPKALGGSTNTSGDGSGSGSSGSSVGYGAMVTSGDSATQAMATDLGILGDLALFQLASVACAGDDRVVLDLDADGVVGAGDLLLAPGRSGLPVGARILPGDDSAGLDGPQIRGVLAWIGNAQPSAGDPLYIAPEGATTVDQRFVRLAPTAGAVASGDPDLGSTVATQPVRVVYADEDGTGSVGHDEPVYLRLGAGGDNIQEGDIRLSPPRAAGATCSGDPSGGQELYEAGSMSAQPAPTVGQRSDLQFRLLNPGPARTITVHADIEGPTGTSRLTTTVQLPAASHRDVVLGWTPAAPGNHAVHLALVPEGEPTHHHADAGTFTVAAAQSSGLTLLLSSSLVNVAALAPNETRLIPLQVTAHGEMARQVRLEVIEAHGISARAASPPVDIPPSSTATLHLEVTGLPLDQNVSAEARRILIRAVADNGVSNDESIDLVTHAGFHGLPGLPLTGTGAALIGAGALAAFFRRRH